MKAKAIYLTALGIAGAVCLAPAARAPRMQVVFQEQENGDYHLSIYGGRSLVCEEQSVTIIRQPDALEPIVIECKH